MGEEPQCVGGAVVCGRGLCGGRGLQVSGGPRCAGGASTCGRGLSIGEKLWCVGRASVDGRASVYGRGLGVWVEPRLLPCLSQVLHCVPLFSSSSSRAYYRTVFPSPLQ